MWCKCVLNGWYRNYDIVGVWCGVVGRVGDGVHGWALVQHQ